MYLTTYPISHWKISISHWRKFELWVIFGLWLTFESWMNFKLLLNYGCFFLIMGEYELWVNMNYGWTFEGFTTNVTSSRTSSVFNWITGHFWLKDLVTVTVNFFNLPKYAVDFLLSGIFLVNRSMTYFRDLFLYWHEKMFFFFFFWWWSLFCQQKYVIIIFVLLSFFTSFSSYFEQNNMIFDL